MAISKMLHATTDGKFIDLRSGALYEYVLPAMSGKVATPTPPVARKVKPSPRAQSYIDEAKRVLARERVETFVAWGLSESGDIVFEHQTSQQEYGHAHVEYKPILEQVGRTKAASVWAVHNHPDGSSEASAHDESLTRTLESALQGYSCGLTRHEIVPGTYIVDSIDKVNSVDIVSHPSAGGAFLYQLSEAEEDAVPSEYSLWSVREAEERRLWRAYGGANPYVR